MQKTRKVRSNGKKFFFLTMLVFLSISFAFADLGYLDPTKPKIEVPTSNVITNVNYSSVNTNDSQFLRGRWWSDSPTIHIEPNVQIWGNDIVALLVGTDSEGNVNTYSPRITWSNCDVGYCAWVLDDSDGNLYNLYTGAVYSNYFVGSGQFLTGISTYNVTYHNKAGTGNCPNGQVVMNTTTGGVQCISLSSIYYAPSINASISGTVQGSLSLVNHTDGLYDEKLMNLTETTGSPALDFRMNFTGITTFNSFIIRYYTSTTIGDSPLIQLWDYTDGIWEDYTTLTTTTTYAIISEPVFDYTSHVSGGIVQMRLYKASNGNINNVYRLDWVAVVKGFGTPSGMEVDPFSIHTDALNYSYFNYTNNILQFTRSPQFDNVTLTSILGYTTITNYLVTILDNSSYGLDGTAYNQPVSVTGKYGKAINFDNADDIMTASDSNLPSGSQNLTVSVWIKTSTNPVFPTSYPQIMRFGTASSTAMFSLAIFPNDGATCLKHGQIGVSQYGSALCTTKTVNDGLWHHIAVAQNGTTYNIYIDGLLNRTGTMTTNRVLTGTMYVGAYVSGSSEFNGTMDDLVILNRTLTASEVLTINNSATPFVDEANTKRIYPFEDSNATVSEISIPPKINNITFMDDTVQTTAWSGSIGGLTEDVYVLDWDYCGNTLHFVDGVYTGFDYGC